VNTGGGGGGGANIPQGSGGKGGSGIVIISYPYQTTTDGLLPQVFLGPSATYPTTYTTTSAPVFSTSNVAFTGAGYSAGNFINFGQTTITMSLGYSIMFQFAWTGSFQPAYERILDFGVSGGNTNSIIVYRNGTASTINFGNFSGGSAQTVTSTSTFPQNTVSGTVVCVYDPSSTGSLKMYVNGSLQATLTGITIIPNGSFPSSLIAKTNATGLDPFANVSIYSMKFYNRVLSATEIARTASPIPYIQMTSRPILPAVLVNPGNSSLAVGSVISVSQTALQPVNGITWSLIPSGAGLAVASSTDYVLTLLITSQVSSLFTVVATNKSGLSSVVQFNVTTPLYSMAFPFTFTNMTKTGSAGPTSITYGTSTPGYGKSSVMTLSGGIQSWIVPTSGSYTITVAGAAGGTDSGGSAIAGNGAVFTITVTLTIGHVLKILVGQKGTNGVESSSLAAGGGGGTFLYNNTTSVLIAAAGGGGGAGVKHTAASYLTSMNGKDGSLTTSGLTGYSNPSGQWTGGAGGTSGNGGGAGSNLYGGAGAGYSGNGSPSSSQTSPNNTLAFLNGGTGYLAGGFGGGGTEANGGGGGGGGYSGGGGGGSDKDGLGGAGGGGGGSYATVSFTSSSATNTGDGYVTITAL
jgi:hypothetical protein